MKNEKINVRLSLGIDIDLIYIISVFRIISFTVLQFLSMNNFFIICITRTP